jgi:hypothetical protein
MTAPADSIEGLVGLHRVLVRVTPEAATGAIVLTVRSEVSTLVEVVMAPLNGLDLALRLISATKQMREVAND